MNDTRKINMIMLKIRDIGKSIFNYLYSEQKNSPKSAETSRKRYIFLLHYFLLLKFFFRVPPFNDLNFKLSYKNKNYM